MRVTSATLTAIAWVGLGLASCGARGNAQEASETSRLPEAGVPSSGDTVPGESAVDARGGTSGPQELCLLSKCANDAECAGCSLGRVRCDRLLSRCVACEPNGQGCAPGETCSPYGLCTPRGATCDLDPNGSPKIACATSKECAACAGHNACDTKSGRCVECTEQDTSACAGNEHCEAGRCEANCPIQCTADADCAACGSAAIGAHACHEGLRRCAECSKTSPCGSGKVCTAQGRCVEPCGGSGKPKGVCSSDVDCRGCPGDAVACEKPINGGDGRCGIPASGCSDLGSRALVLPPPFDSVTNLCSSDGDCSGVATRVNLGKALRDQLGLSFVRDASVSFSMPACASIDVGLPKAQDPVRCGVCVPCKKDADCRPLDVDPLVSEMFGPAGGLLARYALDQIWGDESHVVHFACESVLGDVGVCLPCADPTHACGAAPTSECHTNTECPAGEQCREGRCQAIAGDCLSGGGCANGRVCSWNATAYCCRAPGGGSTECFSDGECPGEVCAWNGKSFTCQPVDPACPPR